MIRPAKPDEAQALAHLHATAWQQAYTGLLPQTLVDALDTETGTANWRRLLSDSANPTAVRLDETPDGELAGFASFGPSRDPDAQPYCRELLAMYYLSPYWGSGRAADLWAALRRELADAGMSRISLWVLFDNAQAIAFYRKQGFVFDGQERSETLRGTSLREVRMVRDAE